MSLWLIVPRDPLIFRDGKPFTATPGERAKSMVFPYPSTLAGAVRTRSGTDAATGQFDASRIAELLGKSIRGPVLVELNNDGQIAEWFFPAPADALLVEKEGAVKRFSLAPLKLTDGAASDQQKLSLVGPVENVKDKPLARPPRYWNKKRMEAWLENPAEVDTVTPDELGMQGPARETRTHVSITTDTQTALFGALFQTSGMEFVELQRKSDETPELSKTRSLALALETDAVMQEGVIFLGGERRIARLEKETGKLPECPAAIRKTIAAQGSCRLILVTPACFEKDYRPVWLESEYGVKVLAAALPRYQTISGWDYEKGAPKPTRRLAPAGSVYFLKFNEQADIGKFMKEVWLQSISDEQQSRNDGFGLALLGTWDGESRVMKIKQEEVKS